MDWKEHKKVCKTLQSDRKAAAANDVDLAGEGMPLIPWVGIALPGELTGYSGEVVCHVTPWNFRDEQTRKSLLSRNRSKSKKDISRSIKYFFKTYQTSATVASQISVIDVGNMCTDAIFLFWLKYPGVRQISVQEGMSGGAKFLQGFTAFAPVPEGWSLESENTEHLSPDVVALMEREIEKLRNDPRFQ